MSYTSAKSKFVQNEIQKTPWSKRKYIDDLLMIERWAIDGFHGPWEHVVTETLKNGYPKQCRIIFGELNPKKWQKLTEGWQEKKLASRREEIKSREEEKEQERQDKREWQKMGGK